MSHEQNHQNAESVPFPNMQYSLDLPFGRLLVTEGAHDALQITPLIPTIEDSPDDYVLKKDAFDIIAVSSQEYEEYADAMRFTLGDSRVFTVVPQAIAHDVKEVESGFTRFSGRILGYDEEQIEERLSEVQAGFSQRLAHSFASITADSAAEQLALQETIGRTSNAMRRLKNVSLASLVGGSATSYFVEAPLPRTLAIMGFVYYLGRTGLNSGHETFVANQPITFDTIKTTRRAPVYDAIHKAYCARYMEDRFSEEDR